MIRSSKLGGTWLQSCSNNDCVDACTWTIVPNDSKLRQKRNLVMQHVSYTPECDTQVHPAKVCHAAKWMAVWACCYVFSYSWESKSCRPMIVPMRRAITGVLWWKNWHDILSTFHTTLDGNGQMHSNAQVTRSPAVADKLAQCFRKI